MKTLTTIKNGAVNGKNARTCIQRRDLAEYGFDCHQAIEIGFYSDHIGIRALEQGDKKVSCVNDRRRGFVYQTIDIRYKPEVRQSMFGNAERLAVKVSDNYIVIEVDKSI